MELHRFGLTTRGMRHSMRHAFYITLVGIAVIVLVGSLVSFKQLSINWQWLAFYVLVSVPLQELVFRGVVQTRLYRFGTFAAVAAASALYAAVHFQNPLLVMLTFAAGTAWGYSFSRQPTLAGPIASHAVLGAVLFLLVL